MRSHPLTPMTDSNLLRLLGRQTSARVELIAWDIVRRGASAIRSAFDALREKGVTYAVVDALDDAGLMALGAAGAPLKLMTGGSGAAMGLPENFRLARLLPPRANAETLPPVMGGAAVLSGSCSPASLRQVDAMKARFPAYRLDPIVLSSDFDAVIDEALQWAGPRVANGPVLFYASAPPAEVAAAQASLGTGRAGSLIEQAMARLAQGLVAVGVGRLVVAGGETSGAVVAALGVRALRIGRQIDPGVPATVSTGKPPIAFALKSGNFGADDFFLKALATLK